MGTALEELSPELMAADPRRYRRCGGELPIGAREAIWTVSFYLFFLWLLCLEPILNELQTLTSFQGARTDS